MPEETATDNPFLSTKRADSNLTISLHPLVLLTVSDHITRHRVRNEDGPVVGALLGQQKGRDITIEHAFQCKAINGPHGDIILDQSWFEDRLQQCI
jgi:COP9 signalosome complex subunit 6